MTETSVTRRDMLAGLGAAAVTAVAGRAAAPKKSTTRRPNVLFLLMDDLGWMDTGVYGSRYYQTPHVDALAKRGTRFTNAYAACPLCSPTRASIMTGKYPCRLRITTPAGHLPPQPDVPLLAERAQPWVKMICPRSRRFLPPAERTLAEAFKEAGYHTGFIGKWHLGLRPEHWPEKQGFDYSFHGAPDPGPRSYFSPYRFPAGTVTDGPKGEYITDRIAEEACQYLQRHKNASTGTEQARPFFLCFWQYAVHAPFQAKEDLTAIYRKRKDPRGKQDCPIMGSMIDSMDQAVGRVMGKLDELGLAASTIVVFFSDNGGNMYNTVEGTTPTNNAPLRSGKGNIHEGGVREPCYIIWPGVTRGGGVCEEIISSIDFYPTLLEMAGLTPKEGKILDGESLVGVLRGTGKLKRDAIFCHFPHRIPATGNLPSTSVRQGDWKLIRVYGEGPDRANAYELYNLREDIGERRNLADRMPEKVKALDALIERHLKDTGALVPKPNPAYDPAAKPRAGRQPKPVAGWRPSNDAKLAVQNGSLHVTCTGGDPFLHSDQVPRHTGPAVLRFRMKSTAQGAGQVFWGTAQARPFHRSRRITIELTHDGQWHEYSVKLPVKGHLVSVRIDPGTARGEVEFDWIRLTGPEGKVLKGWEF